MKNFVIHLKEHFPILGEDGRDPIMTAYLPYNMTEMNRQDWLRPRTAAGDRCAFGADLQQQQEMELRYG